MSKKKLQVEGIMNELEGASFFFSPSPKSPSPQLSPEPQPKLESFYSEPVVKNVNSITVLPETKKEDENIGGEKNKQASNNKSKQASTLASTTASKKAKAYDPVEAIRKTVKQVGKEVIFVRVSPAEKHTLGSIVYSFNEIYGGEGRKTSENEIGRIGLNFLLDDYQENGINSILARVLVALNA
jgi:hypothetical protein